MSLVLSCADARKVVAVLSLMIVTGSAALSQQPAEQPLPLTRVVLYSSGVGYFEHRGQIEGDKQLTFSLKTSDINDLLKSLVVQDLGGGFVTAVNYSSPEPIGRTLQGFTIDLNESPTLAQIFQQLRGHRVEVHGPEKLEGAVVGVESRTIAAATTSLKIDVLNLRTERGLESVRIDTISRTRFLDEKIDREFQQALELLAGSGQSQQKPIKLQFRGQGQRDVAAGYIQESPVWKTSYRLVLVDDAPPQIQGWAIVENTSGQRWREVQLALLSGRPISFQMDLYEPLYSPRPLVAPQQQANLRPRVYEQDLKERPQDAEMADAAGQNLGRRGRTAGGGMFGGMGGGMGGMGGGVPTSGGRGVYRPFVTTGAPANAASNLDLGQGVAAVASGDEVGELFRYVMTSPVSLNRNESAMLPIVNSDVKGEKLAIFNPAVHAKHPLSGLRLTNTTDVHWMQGPITLFDGGAYAGDARIEDISPGSTRLVSYALDLQTEVTTENQDEKVEMIGLEIQTGGLRVTSRGTRDVLYVVKNAASKPRRLLIERPIEASWKPTTPEPAEKTRSLHRYEFAVAAGKTDRLMVTEQQEVREQHALANLTPVQIEVFLGSKVASSNLRKALENAIERKTALATLENERAAVERQIAEVANDQSRIRSNLQSVGTVRGDDPFAAPEKRISRELAQRYLTRLDEQETELQRLRDQLLELKDQETRATRDLERHLKNLNVR